MSTVILNFFQLYLFHPCARLMKSFLKTPTLFHHSSSLFFQLIKFVFDFTYTFVEFINFFGGPHHVSFCLHILYNINKSKCQQKKSAEALFSFIYFHDFSKLPAMMLPYGMIRSTVTANPKSNISA